MLTHEDFVRDLTDYLKHSAMEDIRHIHPTPDTAELPATQAAFNLSSMNYQH